METNLNTKIYNADLYLRLSKEDGDKEESDSITNQKELILDYLKTMEDIKIHEIRVDDGYSGVNFDRPAFQQMLEDIKTGKVDCVITKDLSRFGRNHIEVGKYLEKIFPYLGVRFIAINDNYDSAKSDTQTDNIIIPFKNLIEHIDGNILLHQIIFMQPYSLLLLICYQISKILKPSHQKTTLVSFLLTFQIKAQSNTF